MQKYTHRTKGVLYVSVIGQVSVQYFKIIDCLRGPKGTKSRVHYFQISDTYEAIKLYPFLNCTFKDVLTFHSYISGVYWFSFMIILVEINVKSSFY